MSDQATRTQVEADTRLKRFWWTALISFATVAAGGVVYSTYLRQVRGHLVHWPAMVMGEKKREEQRYERVEMEDVQSRQSKEGNDGDDDQG